MTLPRENFPSHSLSCSMNNRQRGITAASYELRTKREFTHGGDEAVQRLSPLCVLDCDWTEVVAEPDGRYDSPRVAVSHVLLRRTEKEGFSVFVPVQPVNPSLSSATTTAPESSRSDKVTQTSYMIHFKRIRTNETMWSVKSLYLHPEHRRSSWTPSASR